MGILDEVYSKSEKDQLSKMMEILYTRVNEKGIKIDAEELFHEIIGLSPCGGCLEGKDGLLC